MGGSDSFGIAVFVDRDGTINADPVSRYYVHNPSELKLLDAAREGLKEAVRWARVFVISNQAGVGKGLMTSKDLEDITAAIKKAFAADGFSVDGFYYCEHAPDQGCECRKPAVGLLREAVKRSGRVFERMYLVGDTERDILTGKRFGCRTVLVMTGKTMAAAEVEDWNAKPDAIAPDLKAAVLWIRGDCGVKK